MPFFAAILLATVWIKPAEAEEAFNPPFDPVTGKVAPGLVVLMPSDLSRGDHPPGLPPPCQTTTCLEPGHILKFIEEPFTGIDPFENHLFEGVFQEQIVSDDVDFDSFYFYFRLSNTAPAGAPTSHGLLSSLRAYDWGESAALAGWRDDLPGDLNPTEAIRTLDANGVNTIEFQNFGVSEILVPFGPGFSSRLFFVDSDTLDATFGTVEITGSGTTAGSPEVERATVTLMGFVPCGEAVGILGGVPTACSPSLLRIGTVPEPPSLWLMISALLGLTGWGLVGGLGN